MCALIRVLAAAVALAMSTGTAFAVMGKTNTDVALRRAPNPQAELILNLSEGTLVNVGHCSRGWCGVTWNKYGGYVRESALQFQSPPASGPPAIPVFPPYPYKAGHYPTADAYYDLPPYAAIDPSFYRWHHFLLAQERNRYRYMPHIFRGYTGYREDTVGSYVASRGAPANQSHPPAEDGAQSGRAPEQRTAGSTIPAPAPRPQAPEVSPPPAAPAPTPPAPAGITRHPLHQHRAPKRPRYHRHPLHQHRAPKRRRYHRHPLPRTEPPSATRKTTRRHRHELRDVTKGWSVKRSILGQPVYNEKDERVGSVDDIIVTDKAVSYGIINAGGFLGFTKHNVDIPISQFKLVDNKLVLPGATKEALKSRPELEEVTEGRSVKGAILGQAVYNDKDERVGSVEDIIVTPDKAISYAIINAGGFLGLTKHNVAVPVSQFKLVDKKLVLPGATKDALKASPEFQYPQ